MSDTHATGQHERDAPERRPAPAPASALEEGREGAGPFEAHAASLLAAPPDGAPPRHAAALRRLPSADLRRQFAVGLARRHGNGYLQRVLATAPAAPVSVEPVAPTDDAALLEPDGSSTSAGTDSARARPAEELNSPAQHPSGGASDRAPRGRSGTAPTPDDTVDASAPPAAPTPIAASASSHEPEFVQTAVAEASDDDRVVDPSAAPVGAAPGIALRWAVALPRPPRDGRPGVGPRVDGADAVAIARSPLLVPPNGPVGASGALTAWTTRGPPVARAHGAAQRHPAPSSDARPSPERVGVAPDVMLSQPGDEEEVEADRVAESVLRFAAPPHDGPPPVRRAVPAIHRQCAACDDDAVRRVLRRPTAPVEERLSRAIPLEVATGIDALRGGGEPLPPTERGFFEPRLGVDLGRVRLHTGVEAGTIARAIDARAFAVGTDVAFGPGEYRPGTEAGRRLLAHELVHVVQQGGAPPLRRETQAAPIDAAPTSPPSAEPEDEAATEAGAGVCSVCGRRGTGTCDCGQAFAPAPRLARRAVRTDARRVSVATWPVIAPRRERAAGGGPSAIGCVSSPDLPRVISRRDAAPTVRREDDGSSGWAQGLLDSARGKAASEQQALQGETNGRAGEVEGQGQARTTELEGKGAADGAALEGAGAAQEGQITQDAATQNASVQQQASAQAAQLNAQASTNGAAVQQDGAAATSQLNTDFAALNGEAKSAVAGAEGELGGEASSLQAEGEAGAGQVTNEAAALDGQATAKVAAAKDQTQALVDARTALIAGAQGGKGDPEAIQKSLDDQQHRLDALEGEKGGFGGIEEAAEKIGERATALWKGLTGKAQGLLERAAGIAQSAWGTLQQGWSALQGKAAAALAGVKERATAAWTGLKGAATTAWNGLKSGATAVWTGVKERATAAWSGVKERATAVWNGVKSAADAAWQGVQSVAGPIVAAVGGKVSGIIGSVQGLLGKIGSLLSGAVDSLLGSVRRAASGVVEGLKARAEKAWTAVKSVGGKVWERVKGVGSRVWERVKGVAGRAWEGVKSVAGKAWEGLKNLGTKAWEGLKNLGTKVWDGVKKGWEFVKGKAKQAFDWMKGALQKLKETAKKAIDWLKKKAKDGLDWLKKQLGRLKDLLKRAWEWLKQKWEWLKKKAVIRFCLGDHTLFDPIPIKPRTLFNVSTGRRPVWQGAVVTEAGPIIMTVFVQGDAAGGLLGGTLGPGKLRKMCISLAPLVPRYQGHGELHVPAQAAVGATLTGTLGGNANYFGASGTIEGGLQAPLQARGLGSFQAAGDVVYDRGKFSLDSQARLELCLQALASLDAFARVKVGFEAPPTPGGPPLLPGGGTPLPLGPGGTPLLPGCPGPVSPVSPGGPGGGFTGGGGSSGGGGSAGTFAIGSGGAIESAGLPAPVPATNGGAGGGGGAGGAGGGDGSGGGEGAGGGGNLPVPVPAGPIVPFSPPNPRERILWEGRWNLANWASPQKCWRLQLLAPVRGENGEISEADVTLTLDEVPAAEVLQGMFGAAPPVGTGAPPCPPQPPLPPGPPGPGGPGTGGTDPGCDAQAGFLFKAMIRDGGQPKKGDDSARKLGVRGTDVDVDKEGNVLKNGKGMSTTPNDPKIGPKLRVPIACGGDSKDSLFAIAVDTVKATDGLDVNQDATDHANVTNSRVMPLEEFRNQVKSTAGAWVLKLKGKN